MNVAEKLNLFYTTVASDLVEKLPSASVDMDNNLYFFYKGVMPNSYYVSIMTENTILKHLNKLGINKATSLDGIPPRFVRDSASLIACPLTHVVNLSIIQGVVPDDLKLARGVPFYNKSDEPVLVTIAKCLF